MMLCVTFLLNTSSYRVYSQGVSVSDARMNARPVWLRAGPVQCLLNRVKLLRAENEGMMWSCQSMLSALCDVGSGVT